MENSKMSLEQAAEDLISQIRKEMEKAEQDVHFLRGAIEGMQLLVKEYSRIEQSVEQLRKEGEIIEAQQIEPASPIERSESGISKKKTKAKRK